MSRSGEYISTPAYPTPPNFQMVGENAITVSVIQQFELENKIRLHLRETNMLQERHIDCPTGQAY